MNRVTSVLLLMVGGLVIGGNASGTSGPLKPRQNLDHRSGQQSEQPAANASNTHTKSSDPSLFTTVNERVLHGTPLQIDSAGKTEVDDRSSIQIKFDQSQMSDPAPTILNGPTSPTVTIRVEVFAIRGNARTQVAPIANFSEMVSNPPKNSTPGTSGNDVPTLLGHDHSYNPAVNSTVPNTEFDLKSLGISDADEIDVVITNVENREQLIVPLVPRQFGLRPKVSDTVMFVKRLGITKADQAKGISAFNFGPSPGVSYGGTYYARRNAVMRFIQPGVGVTVLFTKWDNPAYDVATGQFVAGTKSSDIQTAFGGQFTLFSNIVQVGYGVNLQVDQKRQYFSIGLSFVNLATKVGGLLGH